MCLWSIKNIKSEKKLIKLDSYLGVSGPKINTQSSSTNDPMAKPFEIEIWGHISWTINQTVKYVCRTLITACHPD